MLRGDKHGEKKKTSNAKFDSPPRIDDFSLIKGIGPVFSGRLHDAGIYTYRQLASLSPTKLTEKVSGLTVNQIKRKNLFSQARKLAPQKKQRKHYQKEVAKQTIRQHYENFTIEFLLDEKKVIRRTRVMHIQSGDADTWAGWESDQLINFIARHTGVYIPEKIPEKSGNSAVCRQSISILDDSYNSTEIKSHDPLSLLSNKRDMCLSSNKNTQSGFTPPTNTTSTSILRLKDLNVLPVGSDSPICTLPQGQHYHVRLTLDFENVDVPIHIPLRYKVTINFKQLGGANRLVAEESSTIKLSDCKTLDIACTNPPPGLYRPDALIILFFDETSPGITASLKGNLIQVF